MTSPTTPRIVVGVDGSDQSRQALRWASELAVTYGARLDAVAAWHIPVPYGVGAVSMEWSPEQDMTKCLTEAVDEVFGAHRPHGLELVVREGNPARVLLDVSVGAMLLVVGSRGHGGFAGLLIGSVSSSVAEHATCPVLVLHGDQAPPTVVS
jgi:nucleotide-binding universal stress UspA family protein